MATFATFLHLHAHEHASIATMKKLFRLSKNPIQKDAEPSILTSVGVHPKLNFELPPVPHPTPYYRVAIIATADALLLRPVISGILRPHSYVQIPWADSIQPEEREYALAAEDTDGEGDWQNSAVVFGIVGCLQLSAGSHLLVITSKNDAGYMLDPRNEVYCIKSVSSIPLNERGAKLALRAISSKYNLNNKLPEPPASELSELQEDPLPITNSSEATTTPKVKFAEYHQTHSEVSHSNSSTRSSSPVPSMSSASSGGPLAFDASGEESAEDKEIAKNLMPRLSFWSMMPGRRNSAYDLVTEKFRGQTDRVEVVPSSETLPTLQETLRRSYPGPSTDSERRSEFDNKIMKETIRELSKGVFFFAYNLDITTSLQHKRAELARVNKSFRVGETVQASENLENSSYMSEPNPTLPLWKRATKHFWWNEALSQPFIDAGLHPYVLPIIQGYVQTTKFGIPREPEPSETGHAAIVDYTLISRRSRDRAGLRYQRRGIDDDANVANFVETEAIVHVERESVSNVFSYIQIRGSIPLFWTQPGFGMKPAPVLDPERISQNADVIRRHFAKTISRYGQHTIVNLAEQHGKEGAITTAYRDHVHALASKDVKYVEYDFHSETRGMKYENISKLVDKLDKTFEHQSFSWFSGDKIMSEQKAVFRVNCIDCLDRTNVVQSAFARHMLKNQLKVVALYNPEEPVTAGMNAAFNDIWANNGDAISKAYAGTSALKGDFTRTGKRDIAGMLNDGMNSLARMYSSTFSDWFSQAVIDFMLGSRTLSVFSEFLEKLQSTDPRDRIRMDRIRTEAIADSVSRVLQEGERLLSGWTLLSPSELNMRLSDRLEEKVLLLSVTALYVISYDYTLEKVVKYTKVPLDSIISLTKGEYIMSPLEEGSRNPVQNYGFLVNYHPTSDSTRVSSYSVLNHNEEGEAAIDPSVLRRPPARRQSTTILSTMLNKINNVEEAETLRTHSFVAFKALPIDPARVRRMTGSFEEPAPSELWVHDCKQAVEVMVDAIAQAIHATASDDVWIPIEDAPIVSLRDAQRSTTVMAKMEYEFKRLLWLGS